MTHRIQNRQEILFEGLSEGEFLALPLDEIDKLVVIGEPIIFLAGSATVLGQFKMNDNILVIELAQIDGGGEGVLLSLGSLASQYCRLRGLDSIEWIVLAANCAKPNLKLRRVLDRRGFRLCDVPEIGAAYQLLETIMPSEDRPQSRRGWAEESKKLAAIGDDRSVMPEFAYEADKKLK